MNKFNKLYNLILESIIILNKAQRVAIILKCDFLTDEQKKTWIHKLDELNNNKLADFLCKYVVNKDLNDIFDSKILKVKKILELNPSIDTQSYKGNLDLFINQYKQSITKHLLKKAAKDELGLDKIPLFTNKATCPKGVIIYTVEDSKNGLKAVRKIVDAQWGKDANPWCLITRKNKSLNKAWEYWQQYNSIPKRIAFQNGNLLAFSANDSKHNIWWDRNNNLSYSLKLLDGSLLKRSLLLPIDILTKYPNLILNKLTNRYDSKQSIRIEDNNLINGKIPIPFGVIEGNFDCSKCVELISLLNNPTSVKGNFLCYGCNNLTSLLYAPKKVEGDFNCDACHKLTSLKNGPLYVGGDYKCNLNYTNITSLEGAPEYIGGILFCDGCWNLKVTEEERKKYQIIGCRK